MKILFLALGFILASCSSNSKKMDDKNSMADSKKEAMKKTEMKKTEMKKEVAKKTGTKKEMAKSSDGKFGKKVSCAYGENERVLENKFSDNGGCEVLYTKDGSTSSIATAQNELDYCQSVVDRVAGKLADAGFNCK